MTFNLPDSDVFEEYRKKYEQTRLASKLEEKYRLKPYFLKYRIHYIISVVSTWCFNLFSAITASTLFFSFILSVSNIFVATAGTIIGIVLLEWAKRATNTTFWEDWFQFRRYNKIWIVALFLTSASIASSYFGASKFVVTLKGDYQDKNSAEIPEIAELKKSISENAAAISDYKTNPKWRVSGDKSKELRWDVQHNVLPNLEDTKMSLEKQYFEMTGTVFASNEQGKKEYKLTTLLEAKSFAAITLMLEILFLFSFWYKEKYEYFSHRDFSKTETKSETEKEKRKPESDIPDIKTEKPLKIVEFSEMKGSKRGTENTIRVSGFTKAFTKSALKQKIKEYEWKIESKTGRPETNNENLKKLKQAYFDLTGQAYSEISKTA